MVHVLCTRHTLTRKLGLTHNKTTGGVADIVAEVLTVSGYCLDKINID